LCRSRACTPLGSGDSTVGSWRLCGQCVDCGVADWLVAERPIQQARRAVSMQHTESQQPTEPVDPIVRWLAATRWPLGKLPDRLSCPAGRGLAVVAWLADRDRPHSTLYGWRLLVDHELSPVRWWLHGGSPDRERVVRAIRYSRWSG